MYLRNSRALIQRGMHGAMFDNHRSFIVSMHLAAFDMFASVARWRIYFIELVELDSCRSLDVLTPPLTFCFAHRANGTSTTSTRQIQRFASISMDCATTLNCSHVDVTSRRLRLPR